MSRLTLLATVAVLFLSAGGANAKTISGELHCAAWQDVAGVWILGERSGWHGKTYTLGNRPYIGKYAVDNAVKGELMKAWIYCSLRGSQSYTTSYSEFRVGNGNTRHICHRDAGWVCTGIGVGDCALKLIFQDRNVFRFWLCTLKYN